jgi:predicted unusual protein kinase regulating ubiquinone biosynthesis (AarF/ABC1/UbiB family)
MIMELIHILGIGSVECIKMLYTRKFDTISFWNKCMKVNVIYTKFFQSCALNYDIHVEIHNIPYDEKELVYPTDIQVSKVIGSGLISIVFEGITEAGQPVVVKTKRKHIEQRVQTSLTKLYHLLTWINWISPIPGLLESYYEMTTNFKKQLDFVSEYNNHQRFYEMFKECDYIKVPQLYSESSENRIVMEKLEGIPISELTTEQKERCVSWMSKMIIQGFVKHGFVHSDLHAGNIMFNDTYLGIIDFGFMLSITKEETTIMREMFKELAMDNFNKAADHMMYFIEHIDSLDSRQLEDVKEFIIHICQKSTVVDKLITVYDILQIMKKLRMYNLKISPIFYNFTIGLTSVEMVLKKLSSSSTDFMISAIIEILSIQIENSEGEDHSN